jgi:4-amino-4-deoxy-L-arabinose transferase-like glycosyltransferase
VTSRSRREGLWAIGFLAVLAGFGVALTDDLGRPWVEAHDYNGAAWSQAAHNHRRAGLRQTLGVASAFYFGPLPIPRTAANGYYTHHPPLLPLAVAGTFALFGERERAARLVPVTASLAGLVLLWLLVRACVGDRAATLASVAFALQPMAFFIGQMVNFEPCALAWMLAALVVLRHLMAAARWSWQPAALLAVFLAGMLTALHMYLFALVAAGWLALRSARERRLAWAILGAAGVSLAVFLVHVRLACPDAWANAWGALALRAGNLGLHAAQRFTWTQWLARQQEFLGTRITVWAWALGAAGALRLAREARGHRGARWLACAMLGIVAMNAAYLVGFRNASYVHDYAGFYLVAPVAVAAGLALEELFVWGQGSAWRTAASVVACAALLTAMGTSAETALRTVRQPFHLLDARAVEPPELIPRLGRAIRAAFPPRVEVLCNFQETYGPHLAYYAQRTLLNNLTTPEDWRRHLLTRRPAGGVIWLGAPGAEALVPSLPRRRVQIVEIAGVPFLFWGARRRPIRAHDAAWRRSRSAVNASPGPTAGRGGRRRAFVHSTSASRYV